MISEITDGVILDYVPDALGSIHSVIDQDANVVKTMRYKPYGEVLSRSGTVADRHYQWVGTYGYRATFAPSSSHYVRARHYTATAGSWTTVDPLWPDEKAYGYVGGRVTRSTDPTGTQICAIGALLDPCSQYRLAPGIAIIKCDCHVCYKPFPGDPPGIEKCVKAHEQVHCNQLKQGKPYVYCGADGLIKNTDPSKAECPGIAEFVRCMTGDYKVDPCAKGKGKPECVEMCAACETLAGGRGYPTQKLNCTTVPGKVKTACKNSCGVVMP